MFKVLISFDYQGYGDWAGEVEYTTSSVLEAIRLFLIEHPSEDHFEVRQG